MLEKRFFIHRFLLLVISSFSILYHQSHESYAGSTAIINEQFVGKAITLSRSLLATHASEIFVSGSFVSKNETLKSIMGLRNNIANGTISSEQGLSMIRRYVVEGKAYVLPAKTIIVIDKAQDITNMGMTYCVLIFSYKGETSIQRGIAFCNDLR